MSRVLPNSDVAVGGNWNSTLGNFYSAVAKLVPDACPGTDYIQSTYPPGPLSGTVKLGLPTLGAIPKNCYVRVYGLGDAITFQVFVRQGATIMFQSQNDGALHASAGEVDVATPKVNAPSSTSGWSVEISFTANPGAIGAKIYGIEVDFDLQTRCLPLSGGGDGVTWSSTAGVDFTTPVAKLVPEGCPGSGHIDSVYIGATVQLWSLGNLSFIPTICIVKLYGEAGYSGGTTWGANVLQNGVPIWEWGSQTWPGTAAETQNAPPQVAVPAGMNNWQVAIEVSANSPPDNIRMWGLEVDFGGGGGSGPGGQTGVNASFLLTMIDEDVN